MKPDVEWEVPPARWDALVAAAPAATFFHTAGWYAAHGASVGLQPQAAAFRFADGREAVLPLAVQPRFRGLGRLALAGIEGGYGGLLAASPLLVGEAQALYRLAAQRFPDLAVAGNPFAPGAFVPASDAREEHATQLLTTGPVEAMLAQMEPPRRRKARRGLAAGFRLEVVHPLAEADVARFYPLYAACAAGWSYRRWVRDERYFRLLLRHAGPQMALFLAYAGDELAGFQLLGLHGQTASALYLATAPAHEPAQVGPFLAAVPPAWCHERGFVRYDLLASGQLDAVRAYKASLGASTLGYAGVRLTSRWGGLLAAAATLWQRLPAPRPRVQPLGAPG